MKKNIINARKWLKQAKHDLTIAKRNIEIEGYDVSAFLAHQAVEKLLKSLMILKKNKLPKTHLIDDIARDLNLSNEIIELVNDLTIDYTFSRYPDISNSVPYEEYNEIIARDKINKAEIIFKKLKKDYEPLEE